MAHVDIAELSDVLAITVDRWLETFTPEQVAHALADAFVLRTGQRMLAVVSPPVAVLTDSELARLERQVDGQWLAAKAVWLFLRTAEPYLHQTAINLGRQLSARYRKQRKCGPTRQYWIETPIVPIAPASE